MDAQDLALELQPGIQTGDTAGAIACVSDFMSMLPETPFHVVLELDFTNEPQKLAEACMDFVTTECSDFALKTIYAEMNGFSINPKMWHFSYFGFDRYGGHESYDWLSAWQAESLTIIKLEGMEELQAVYASSAFHASKYAKAESHASLLVTYKFQDLIRRSAQLMEQPQPPILATSHDSDYIAEFTAN